MLILGVDPSLTSTGLATPNGQAWEVKTKLRGMARLHLLASTVVATALADDVDLVAIEGYSYGSKYNSEVLGELGGAIRLALWMESVPWVSIPPRSLKKYATGNGNASKDDMVQAARLHLGYEGKSNDEADALWLQAMTLDAHGEALVELPEKQRNQLSGWSMFATTWDPRP